MEKRVGLEFRHEVSTDFSICKLSKSAGFRLENPVPVLFCAPVPIHNPFIPLVVMPSFCPLLKHVPEIEIHPSERLFRDNMAMIVCPAGNHRIECLN